MSSAGVSRTLSGMAMAPARSGAVVAFEQLVVIEAEIRDAVAGLDPGGEEAGGEALAALAEFGVGEAAVAGDHAGLLAVKIHGAIEAADRGQGHVHDLESISAEWRGKTLEIHRRKGRLGRRGEPEA